MNILALETSGKQSQVAVLSDGKLLLLAEQQSSHSQILLNLVADALRASELTLQALDCIAVCQGPGSFTGLRIGIAAAQGLAFSLKLPVAPISSLATLAWQAAEQARASDAEPITVLATLDARKQQVYCGWFRCHGNQIIALGEQQVVAPESITPPNVDKHVVKDAAVDVVERAADIAHSPIFANPSVVGPAELQEPVYVVGSGLDYKQRMPAWARAMPTLDGCESPSAGALARLGEQCFLAGQALEATALQPVYLRDKVTD